jgi:hypothetical protein
MPEQWAMSAELGLRCRLSRPRPADSMPPMPAEPLDRSAPDLERDWPAQAADAIVDVVDKVRLQTTAKAVVAARALVFGVVISILAVVAATTFVVFLVRITQVGVASIADLAGYEMEHAQAVYISYLVVGAVLTFAGGIFWRMANRRAMRGGLEEGT